MVGSLVQYTGAETGGEEELEGFTGTNIVQSIITRSGTYAYHMESGENIQIDRNGAVASFIEGFAIRFEDKTPSTPTVFASFTDGGGNDDWDLLLQADGDLEFRDAGGSVLVTVTDPFVLKNWYYIEVYWEGVDSGDVELFIDGVSKFSSTTADTNPGSATEDMDFTAANGLEFYIDDVYLMNNVVDETERLSRFEVYMKQGAQTGVTPDTSDLSDDDLDEGGWELASETPLNEQSQTAAASYTGTSVVAGVVYADGAGDKLGPAGDDRFTGTTVKGIKAIWRMARSGGGATAQFGELGNDGGAATDIGTTGDLNLTTGYVNYDFVPSDPTVIPLVTEHGAIGFSKDGGGQDLDVAEMWMMFAVITNAPTITALSDSDLEYPDQNYFVGPFEI